MKKSLAAILVVLGVFGVACGTSSSSSTEKGAMAATQPGQAAADSTTTTQAPTTTTTEGPTTTTTVKTTFKAGEIQTVGPLLAMPLRIDRNYVASGASPHPGKKIVTIEFQVKNAGTAPARITGFQTKLKDSTFAQYDTSLWLVGREPEFPVVPQDLAAGDTIRGWVSFEVPNAAAGFQFSFEHKWFVDGPPLIWTL